MKMLHIKNILFVVIIALYTVSCNLNTSSQIANPSNDATITYVSIIANDSSPKASSAVFTIDNVNGLIYNTDSLPYGTRIDSLQLGFLFKSSLGYVVNDTISQSSGLTQSGYAGTTTVYLDLNKTTKVKNLATDGKSTKEYKITVNVHKAESYLHVWTLLKLSVMDNAPENQKALMLDDKFYYFLGSGTVNTLYTSTNAVNWSGAGTVTGLPLDAKLRNIVVYNNAFYLLHNGKTLYTSTNGTSWTSSSIIGDANYNYEALLFSFKNKIWAVARNKVNNFVRIACSADGVTWSFNGKTMFYNNFPISDFAATTFQPIIGREKVIVLGGIDAFGKRLNTRWSAENITSTDTLNWANLYNIKSKLDSISNVGVEYYGSKLLMIGGTDKNNQIVVDTLQLRHSEDEGLTWLKPDTAVNKLPEDFAYRTNASMVVDKKNKTLYVIGGKSYTKNVSDVWKIKVNFYSFKDYLDGTVKY